jgi:hypothetical protein
VIRISLLPAPPSRPSSSGSVNWPREGTEIELFSQPSATQPGVPPKHVFGTLNGTAEELRRLAEAIDQALHGGPQVYETMLSNGVAFRLLIDRIGPAVPTV